MKVPAIIRQRSSSARLWCILCTVLLISALCPWQYAYAQDAYSDTAIVSESSEDVSDTDEVSGEEAEGDGDSSATEAEEETSGEDTSNQDASGESDGVTDGVDGDAIEELSDVDSSTSDDSDTSNSGTSNSSDASESSDTSDTSEPSAASSSTYYTTANLYLAGEDNTILPGNTVYFTNANTPVTTGSLPVEPTEEKTAKLTDNGDGTYTVVVQVVNPVLTLQSLGSGTNISVSSYQTSSDLVGSTASITTRISEVTFLLQEQQDTYEITNCSVYPTLMGSTYSNLRLHLSLDFDEVTSEGQSSTSSSKATTATSKSTSKTSSSNTSSASSSRIKTTSDGRLAQGTYTVSANIWFEKSVTGLPLNPHLTSSSFPPQDPVTNNAKLVVDSSGAATVYIPIVIQSRIMSVNSVSGASVASTTSNASGVTMVVLSLGTLSASDTSVSGTCTANITLGWLAQTMASGIVNGVWDHTWKAQWQVSFSTAGVAASGSGALSSSQLAAIAGVEDATENEDDAALAALEAFTTPEAGAATGTAANAEESEAAKGANRLWYVLGIGVVVLALAGVGLYIWRARHKQNATE